MIKKYNILVVPTVYESPLYTVIKTYDIRHLGFHTSPDGILDWLEALGVRCWQQKHDGMHDHVYETQVQSSGS